MRSFANPTSRAATENSSFFSPAYPPELLEACRKAKPRDIAALRVTRKRNALQNERALTGAAVDSPSDAGSGGQQLRTLDAGVKRCGRKYNEAKANADKLEEEVRRRSDELLELEGESKALDEMLEGNNEDARKIARLSAEIKAVDDGTEGVLDYRRKLLHMKQRLDCNSAALDEYLAEMTETLALAQAERDKNKRMLAELESGLTCASIELDDTLRVSLIVVRVCRLFCTDTHNLKPSGCLPSRRIEEPPARPEAARGQRGVQDGRMEQAAARVQHRAPRHLHGRREARP